MKRRQQKVADFLSSLKVGDQVVTSGGIYGTSLRVAGDQAVQIQIAERVRVDISRNAIVGFRQAAFRGARRQRYLVANKNIQWTGNHHRCACSWIFAAVGVYPIIASQYGITSPSWLMAETAQASGSISRAACTSCSASRPTTPSASRASRRWSGCAKRSGPATSTSPVSTMPTIAQIRVQRRAAGAGRGLPQRSRRRSGRQLRPESGHEWQLHLHDEAEHSGDPPPGSRCVAARQTIERRVNELGVAEPSIAQQGANPAIRSWSSCPA